MKEPSQMRPTYSLRYKLVFFNVLIIAALRGLMILSIRTVVMKQLYRHPLTAVSSSSGQPHAVGYIIRKRPSSSGSGLVSAGNGAPYDYDYDGFAGKENPASRSVNDGNDEQVCYRFIDSLSWGFGSETNKAPPESYPNAPL